MDFLLLPTVMLLVLGLCLRMSLGMLYGARGPSPDDGVYLLMRILSWGLLLVPAATLAVMATNLLAIILLAVVVEAFFELTLARRAAQRRGAWRLVAASRGDGAAAGVSLEFHNPRFTGIVGRAFRRLSSDLAHGAPWQQALYQNRQALPREAPAFAAMAGDAHPADATDLDESHDAAYWEVKHQILQRIGYLLVVGMWMTAVVTFVMIRIVPSYQEIFEDFELELPETSTNFIAMANAIESPPGLILVLIILLLALASGLAAFCYLCDWPVLAPILDRVTFSRHRAMVMRLLATALAAGKPVNEALAQLASGWGAYPSGVVRRRLAGAREGVEAGRPWPDALVKNYLITAGDASVLRTAQDVGNAPWALRMLAARRLRLMAFRWSAGQHIVYTALILLLGLFVLWFGIAMIVPLSDMVVTLSW